MKKKIVDKFYLSYVIFVFMKYMIKRIQTLSKVKYKKFKNKTFIGFDNNNFKSIFILGSGASVNSYSLDQWNLISNNHSFGFNSWYKHNFVPNFYSLEVDNDNNNWKNKLSDLKRLKDEYKNVPIMLRGAINRKVNLDLLEDDFNWHLPIELEIPIANDKQLKKLLWIFKILSKFSIFNYNFIFGTGASLVSIILTAWRMGYKEIILCGVDLNNTKYFFNSKRNIRQNYYEEANEKPGNLNELHSTARGNRESISVQKIVYEINDFLLRPNNIKLYVAKSTSLLAEKLPIYFEK